MGLDGGSLPNRREYLVKTKSENKSSYRSEYKKHAEKIWKTCALSGKPLWEPVVSCAKGHLYRKESVLKVLIKRKLREYGEEPRSRKAEKIPHIRSMKDFVTLRMEVNPEKYIVAVSGEDHAACDDSSMENFWICPLTQKVANGVTKFIFFYPCGHVMAGECVRAGKKDSIPCVLCGQIGSYFSINPDVDEVVLQQKRYEECMNEANTVKIEWKG